MRKYMIVIVTFVITILLTIVSGFVMKGNYTYIDNDFINQNNVVDASYITILDHYKKLLNAKNINAEILKVKVIDKKVENKQLIGEAEVLENYTKNYSVGSNICYIENVTLSYCGNELDYISDTSDVMTKVGDEYIMAVIPSKYGNGFYDLAYPNVSVMKVSLDGKYKINLINDNIELVDDINGETQLYMIDENIDLSVYDAFSNNSSKDMILECNSFILDMYNKYQELLKRE